MTSLSEQGYRLPAEWETQQAIVLTWPTNAETWQDIIEDVRQVYVNLICQIGDHQPVWLYVPDEQTKIDVERRVLQAGGAGVQLNCLVKPLTDSWVRDYGPITVINSSTRARLMTCWQFDGWGDKYGSAYHQDSQMPLHLADIKSIPYVAVPYVLEGGSIETNGAGVMLTTDECLLEAARNDGVSRQAWNHLFQDYFGIRKTIWLNVSIEGDDTDGHIDNAARFVNSNTVVCAPIGSILATLRSETNAHGSPLQVVPLPLPDAVMFKQKRMPASYANFLITNQKVLVPVYQVPQDEQALATLRELFPTRTVVGIPARPLIIGYGSIHCLSMQIPAGIN